MELQQRAEILRHPAGGERAEVNKSWWESWKELRESESPLLSLNFLSGIGECARRRSDDWADITEGGHMQAQRDTFRFPGDNT